MHEFRARLRGEQVGPRLLAEKNPPEAADELSLAGVAIRRTEVRRSNNRTGTRQPVSGERVTIRTSDGEQIADLKNLSAGGAMVEGLEAKLFDRVELILDGTFQASCEVKWLKGKRTGLEFWPGTKVECSDRTRRRLAAEIAATLFPTAEIPTPKPADPGPVDGGGHRHATRHKLVWSATLHHNFQSETVRIRNISASGTLLEFSGELDVGAKPVLEIEGAGILDCSVVWRFGDQAGLKFERSFNVSLLARNAPHLAATPVRGGTQKAYIDLDQLSLEQLQEELGGFLSR